MAVFWPLTFWSSSVFIGHIDHLFPVGE
jgi:hypothetical protein